MDREQTLACLRDPAIARAVRLEAEGAIRAGANSTPTFYIEGGLLVGAHPIEVFRPILDSIVGVRQRQPADKN
jgi:predicted DsbA family dithiol-disulfide isomerase